MPGPCPALQSQPGVKPAGLAGWCPLPRWAWLLACIAYPGKRRRAVPFTEKQRKLMNAADHDPEIAREHGMSGRTAHRLADEANRYKKEGKERPAVKAVEVIDLAHVFGPPPRV